MENNTFIKADRMSILLIIHMDICYAIINIVYTMFICIFIYATLWFVSYQWARRYIHNNA